MKTYSINIAKAYTMSDWRGMPAHTHLAKVTLCDTAGHDGAMLELVALSRVYPWPEYHLTLTANEVITYRETLGSTAPQDFLDKHQWAGPSIHQE